MFITLFQLLMPLVALVVPAAIITRAIYLLHKTNTPLGRWTRRALKQVFDID